MGVNVVHLLCFVLALSNGQNVVIKLNETKLPTDLHNGFTEKIGNFSLELLYHTAKQEKGNNLIMSPITVWTILAVTGEGASGNTLAQIDYALRLELNKTVTRVGFKDVARWLQVHTNTIELAKLNAIFVNEEKLPLNDFRSIAKNYYDTEVVSLNYSQVGESTVNKLNDAISQFTHGKISKIVDDSFFSEGEMVMASALYFKGQWTVPFNQSSTSVMPFYDSNGKQIGQVNMMYNRFAYPFANIKHLQAKICELPYGVENRLSMIIMIPHLNVSLQDMFRNMKNVPMDTLFSELRIAREDYSDEEVDLFLPRFKIQSNLVLTDMLKNNFGIVDLFEKFSARLPLMSRVPLYVTKIIHKAEIEVTEEGSTAAGVTVAEFANRIGITRFEANRPFSYMIVEKVTNTVVFGGIYETPSLY